MSSLENDCRYDLFVSYAHVDDAGGQVEALVQAIQEEHGRFTPTPLQVFFDHQAIGSMQDWEHRILRGLRESGVMLAVLSPAYFAATIAGASGRPISSTSWPWHCPVRHCTDLRYYSP